jgi:hypothetical protein
MAVNAENIGKAEELLSKLTSQMGPPDERTHRNIDALRASIGEYHRSAKQADDTGKLTADSPASGGVPNKVEAGGPLDYTSWYEPSVDSVKQRLANDPKLVERLNLQSWTSSPDQINDINEGTTAYQVVADDDWKQAAENAQRDRRNVTRYSKVALTEDPIEKVAGFVGKHGSALASAVGNVLNPTASLQRREYRKEEQSLADKGINAQLVPSEAQVQEVEDRSPVATGIGTFAGAAAPMAVGNMAVGATMKGLGYAARKPIGKALVGGIGGALGSVAEGELNAADEVFGKNEGTVDDYLLGASERITGNAVTGYLLGKGGDLVSQGSRVLQKGLRESERFGDVNKLEAAGGGTHPIKGITVPENVQRNISEASKVGAIGRPEDLAAARVAPKISEYVDKQAQETYNAISENLTKYHNSKEGLIPQRITEPVKVAIDFIKSRLNKGDLGTISATNPIVVKNLREKLSRFVERKEVSVAQFEAMKARYGDDIIEMDPTEADELFGVKTTQNEKSTTFPNNDEEVLRDMHGKRIYVDPEEAAEYAAGRSPFKNPFRATDGKPVQSPDGLTPPENLLSEGQSLLGEGTIATPTEGLSVSGESNPFRLPAMQTPIPSIYPVKDPPHLINQREYLKNILGPGKQARSIENQKLLGMGKEFADIHPGGEPSYPNNSGPDTKTVLVPRAYASKQMEDNIQMIADEIKNSTDDKGWLNTLDQSFRKVRDKFGGNDHTPIGEKLDDGTELSGLSALQRAHSRAQEKLKQVKTDTSAEYGSAIHNKVRAFDTGGNFAADKELLQQAKELGIEPQLREVTGSAVGPSLKGRAFLNSPKGVWQGGLDAATFRADPILRAIGNVEPNPFAAHPNSPAGRIQKYLFEDGAKNMLNLQGGRLGRFGNEIQDEQNQ